MCVNEQVKGGKRLPQQHTSVSGFEGLYVARGVLLLHSHLLPQRLCSHSVDDTVANLQRAAHRVNGTRARTVLTASPVWLYLFGLLSQAVGHRIWVNIFPLCSNAAEDICPSVQHLGKRGLLWERTSSHRGSNLLLLLEPLTCSRRWSLDR